MSTILEWARKTREVGQYHLLENTGEEGTTSNVPINGDTPTNTNGTTPTNTNGATPTNTNGAPPTNTNGAPPTLVNGSYDHLSPPTGYDKVINNDDEDAPIY